MMSMDREDRLEAQTFRQFDLDAILDETGDEAQWRLEIFRYLDQFYDSDSRFRYRIPCDEFDQAGTEWFNVSEDVKSTVHLRGRLVVLDFFTYCCINCMHILPHLHALERKFLEGDLAIIGVHSAKFENEKLSENVKNAIRRYGIQHPVLNDPKMQLWTLCQIICWPTLVVVGPDGSIIYKFIGEKNISRYGPYIKIFMEYFYGKGQITNFKTLPMKPLTDKFPTDQLRAPGKLSTSKSFLAVADTANHRILVFDKESRCIDQAVGEMVPGFLDGSFAICRFNSPQGVCWFDGHLFVADTGNHAIRQINFDTQVVTTVVGTGRQGNDLVGGLEARLQPISSPWDICSWKEQLILIAMAGSHQIWAHAPVTDVPVFGGKILVRSGHCVCIAGSGKEENRNTSYPLKAGFAQPSGLCLSEDQRLLFVADSESSSIRVIDMTTGVVKNVCGGQIDPMDLFAFGDKDGKGTEARLQHPLGVCWDHAGCRVFMIDSYNHKLKTVDPATRVCQTIDLAPPLNEPGGICIDADRFRLYIADTNNNQIKILDSRSFELLSTIGPSLELGIPESHTVLSEKGDEIDAPTSHEAVEYHENHKVKKDCQLSVSVNLGGRLKLNEEAPQQCSLKVSGKTLYKWDLRKTIRMDPEMLAKGDEGHARAAEVECRLVLCDGARGTCEFITLKKEIVLSLDPKGDEAILVKIDASDL